MTNLKTGTSMSTIVVTKKAKDKQIINFKRANARKKRANICLECNDNNEGFCNKHKAWCGRVNYICLGIKDPYEYKMPKTTKNTPVKRKKTKKKSKKIKKNH